MAMVARAGRGEWRRGLWGILGVTFGARVDSLTSGCAAGRALLSSPPVLAVRRCMRVYVGLVLELYQLFRLVSVVLVLDVLFGLVLELYQLFRLVSVVLGLDVPFVVFVAFMDYGPWGWSGRCSRIAARLRGLRDLSISPEGADRPQERRLPQSWCSSLAATSRRSDGQ